MTQANPNRGITNQPYQCFQSQRHGTSRRVKKKTTGFGKGRLLHVAVQPSVNRVILSLYLESEIIEHLFMIKTCVDLNEGQGQYN